MSERRIDIRLYLHGYYYLLRGTAIVLRRGRGYGSPSERDCLLLQTYWPDGF